jgi:hypothetical protein
MGGADTSATTTSWSSACSAGTAVASGGSGEPRRHPPLAPVEEDNAALAARIERQQQQLRDGFMARDDTIRRLTDALAAAPANVPMRLQTPTQRPSPMLSPSATSGCRGGDCAAHRAGAAGIASYPLTLQRRAAPVSAERERDALAAELAAAERQIERLMPAEMQEAQGPGARPADLCVLMSVAATIRFRSLGPGGGRMAGFCTTMGVSEHNAAMIPGLVSRADMVVFPVDCISHEAAIAVKRSCRLMGKRYVPLRTSSSGLPAHRACGCAG